MEADLMRRIQVALSTVGARVFRNNVGMGWTGRIKKFTQKDFVTVYPGDVLIREARPLHAGLDKSSGDLIGFDIATGKFISCEVKVPGEKPTPEQFDWLNAVRVAHGIAFWACSEDEAIKKFQQVLHGPV